MPGFRLNLFEEGEPPCIYDEASMSFFPQQSREIDNAMAN